MDFQCDRIAPAVIGPLLRGFRKATKYLSPSLVVKASRMHKPNGRDRQATIVVTIGKPNYAERGFIKSAQRSGEPFPIKRVQLKAWRAV